MFIRSLGLVIWVSVSEWLWSQPASLPACQPASLPRVLYSQAENTYSDMGGVQDRVFFYVELC